MAAGYVIRKNQYYDSLFLMGINNRLSDHAGVNQTAVLMGIDTNKEMLANIGFQDELIDAAQPSDLIVAVIAESQQIVDDVLGNLDTTLETMEGNRIPSVWRTLEDGLVQKPEANLAVFSIPGEFVAREAQKAIDSGLNTFIFSSNVPVEDEINLKRSARRRNLLVMGPDCGTSLIGGVGIGFSNKVHQGNIGVIGASGTGLQEFTCQVHNAGLGISHAIGTGTRDVTDEVGGITTFDALAALERDKNTKVIAVISKPPGKQVLKELVTKLEGCPKPTVCCFLGSELHDEIEEGMVFTRTIDEAADWVNYLTAGGPVPSGITFSEAELEAAKNEQKRWSPEQKYLRGVFAGGTFCYQSQLILKDAGKAVYSNTPLDPKNALEDPEQSIENTLVDMGDETFTLGKPHPMIDGTLRYQRILAESQDPEVAILFLDFIFGYNASPDPVGELIDSVIEAKLAFNNRQTHLTVVASLCGTADDPQDLNVQADLLAQQGVYTFGSNAKAAAFCALLLEGK